VLPLLGMGVETKNDIRAAINAGKIVTAHQSAITVGTWSGFGYTVIDPVTGAGAYMISGGTNGGVIDAMSNLLTGISAKIGLHSLVLNAGGGLAATIGNFLALASFLLGIIKALFNCVSEQATRDMIVATTFFNTLGIATLGVAGELFSNLAAAGTLSVGIAGALFWLSGIVVALAVGALIGYLYSIDPNCTARNRFRFNFNRIQREFV